MEGVSGPLGEALRVHKRLILLSKDIENLVEIARQTIEGGGKIFLFGNGGSATDAMHLAAECPGKAVIALSSNIASITSIGNDLNFESIFSIQLAGLCKKGDLAIGMSTSGHSANVLEAIEAAKKLGAKTVGLTGDEFKGGPLAKLADFSIVVPSKEVGRVQECHLLIGHILTDALNE